MSTQSAGGACIACASYIKGVCWMHGVKVRGSTAGRMCFRAKAMNAKKKLRKHSKTPTRSALVRPTCSACDVPWDEHLGIAGTCRKLNKARGALKVIRTWASFRDGELLTAKDAMNLCIKVLKETAPNAGAHGRRSRTVRPLVGHSGGSNES